MTIETKFEISQPVYIPQLKGTLLIPAFTDHGGGVFRMTNQSSPLPTADIPEEKQTGFAKE